MQLTGQRTSYPKELTSKVWRLTHLYKILDKNGDLITFSPNYSQLLHLAERGTSRYGYILKARQLGLTTLYCIDDLDEALWVPGMSCGIIAHERAALDKIFEIVKRAYENIPPIFKPKTDADNSNEYKFTSRFDGLPLDSSIYVAMKVRSGTVLNLHITESAYIKNRQELVAGSKQAVPKTGRITEETTANGFDAYYDAFMEAYTNTNPGEMDYRAYFYPWINDPDYSLPGELPDITKKEQELKDRYGLTDGQLLWRRWKMKDLKADKKNEGVSLNAEQLFMQEYPITPEEAFQSGAGAVFDQEQIAALVKLPVLKIQQIDELLTIRDHKGLYWERAESLVKKGVWIWRLPDVGKEYVIGVDPSDGQGSDSASINVWTKKPDPVTGKLQQVAQFYGKLLPDDIAEVTKEMAEFYNKAFVGVENNMLSTILFLVKIYDNYFYSTRIDEKTQKKTKKIGYNTNIQTREKMIDDFIMHLDDDLLEINSPVTFNEMRTFVKKVMASGAYKREHANGKFDDSLFADFIALQMVLYRKPQARAF